MTRRNSINKKRRARVKAGKRPGALPGNTNQKRDVYQRSTLSWRAEPVRERRWF